MTVFVLLNDSDPDVTDVLSVSGVSNAVNGTAAMNFNSTAVIFTPAAGFSGQGSFSYAIEDGRGGSASANVTVTVNPAPPGGGAQCGERDAGGGLGGDHRCRVDGWCDYPGQQCDGACG